MTGIQHEQREESGQLDSAPPSAAADLAVFSREAAAAVADAGSKKFSAELLAAVRAVTSFQLALIIVYTRGKQPELIYDTFGAGKAKTALNRFMTATYVLNPVYNAFLAGVKEGVYRITELAPDNYFSPDLTHGLDVRISGGEEIGYRTPGWPKEMAELIILTELPGEALAEISLFRHAAEGYTGDDLARIRAVQPLAAALVRLHMDRRRRISAPKDASRLDDLLRDFGRGLLTARERQVAQMILRGHSGGSIALNLEISQETVKSHRQNLYAKLGVTTQQELFSRFLQSLPL